jgi:hypothetical protein
VDRAGDLAGETALRLAPLRRFGGERGELLDLATLEPGEELQVR